MFQLLNLSKLPYVVIQYIQYFVEQKCLGTGPFLVQTRQTRDNNNLGLSVTTANLQLANGKH